MKEYIETISCTPEELVSILKDLHNKYKKIAGVEICIRYGKCKSDFNPDRVTTVISVYKIGGESIYQGTHADLYHQDLVGEIA